MIRHLTIVFAFFITSIVTAQDYSVTVTERADQGDRTWIDIVLDYGNGTVYRWDDCVSTADLVADRESVLAPLVKRYLEVKAAEAAVPVYVKRAEKDVTETVIEKAALDNKLAAIEAAKDDGK